MRERAGWRHLVAVGGGVQAKVRNPYESGGESGIRTHDRVAPIPVFETGICERCKNRKHRKHPAGALRANACEMAGRQW